MGKKIIIVFLLLSITSAGLIFLSFRTAEEWNSPDFESLPKEIGMWFGEDEHFEPEIYERLAADATLLRKYTNRETNETIWLWLAYYKDQKKSTVHIPRICFIGQGWSTEMENKEEIKIDSKLIDMKKLVLRREDLKQIVYYWFESQGRIFNDELAKNIYRFIGAVISNRTDLTFVRFSAQVVDDNSMDSMKKFIKEIYPLIGQKIPK